MSVSRLVDKKYRDQKRARDKQYRIDHKNKPKPVSSIKDVINHRPNQVHWVVMPLLVLLVMFLLFVLPTFIQ